MAENSKKTSSLGAGKWAVIIIGLIVVIGGVTVAYINYAFPKVKCEAAKHLESSDEMADCYQCHVKTTPKVAQDWYEGKHGVMLVKCFVCHGQPDGKGSIPFAVDPDVNRTCRKCHEPSIDKMQTRFGLPLNCNECHPYHINSLHHAAYEKPVSKRTIE